MHPLGFSYVDLVTKHHSKYALVSCCGHGMAHPISFHLPCLRVQKRILLQLPEQREAAETEIRTHRLVDHENVIKLVGAEIKDQRNGEGLALLLFPFYQVSLMC